MAATLSTSFLGRAVAVNKASSAVASRPALPARGAAVKVEAVFTKNKKVR